MNYNYDINDIIADLNEIESAANMLSLRCQQTRNKLTKAGVSTRAEDKLSAIAAEARRKITIRIKKSK